MTLSGVHSPASAPTAERIALVCFSDVGLGLSGRVSSGIAVACMPSGGSQT